MSEGRSASKSTMISRIFLFLTSIEGFVVVWTILQSPSEADSARLFGLSAMRLMLLGGALVVVLLALGLLFASFWKRSWYKGVRDRLKVRTENRVVLFTVLGLSILGTLAGAQYALYAPVAEEPVVQAFLFRLQPFLIWASLVCAQLIFVMISWHYAILGFRSENRSRFVPVFIVLGFFIVVWIFLAVTGYGFSEETRATGYFRVPGTPILGVQVLLSFVVTLVFVWLWGYFPKFKISALLAVLIRKEFLIGLLLWVIAFTIWMSAPLEPSWFADPPRLPNFTFSPNSDAHMYDAAGQSLLVGSGFWHPHWDSQIRRPMLSGLLAMFHAIRGLGYEEIIVLQVALLAIFPMLVYFFTSELHNQISGLLAAILIILRERNAIILADTITVSHAKILMSDLPATVGVVFFLMLIYKWLKRPIKHPHLPLVAGGVIGFFVLIRSEIGFLLPVVGLVGLWFMRRIPWTWLKGMVLLSFGFLLMVGPWTWRNWQVTGTLYMDTPLNIQRLENILEDVLGREDELGSHAAYKDAFLVPSSLSSSGSQKTAVLSRLIKDEVDKSENSINHYFNGQTQFVYTLPLSPQILMAAANLTADQTLDGFLNSCCSVEKYVRDLPYWWGDWDGGLAHQSYISMALVLVVLSIGIAVLWKEQKLLGVLPILAGFLHVLFFALNRRSGGRWVMEYDWFSVVVLSVGLVQISLGVVTWLRGETPKTWSKFIAEKEILHKSTWSTGHYLCAAIVILAIGASLPISEITIPQQYTESDKNVLVEELLNLEQSILSNEEKSEFANLINKDAGIWYGRALYPRYYESGDGMDGWKDHYKHPFSRFEFYSVGTKNGWFVLPYVDETITFPHAADVLVLGCGHEYYLDVMAMVLYPAGSDTPQEILWRDPASGETEDCFSK